MKTNSTVIVLFTCFSLMVLLTGCSGSDMANKNYENITISRDLTGQATGSASAVYSLPEGTVVCSDEAAAYLMNVAKDNKTPSGTLLTSNPPDKTQYFSVDIDAVMRILDKGKCLVRDESDDRVHLKIEGYYDGSNSTFTLLSCSKTSSISKAEIYFTSNFDYVVKGEITCVYSEQMKYTFQFADLKLK
jgi:hypothetical protein